VDRRLPSMKALRAFEAAARHLSFTLAADELNVTQAAISHRVKTLEERLGVRLFHRYNRKLELTDAGRVYLPSLRDALDMVGAATDRVTERARAATLKVSVVVSFATKWLQPRLPAFAEAHPEIDVRVTADDKLVAFARDDVDVGIRFGRGRYPGLRVDKLMDDQIVPVCSPALLEGPHPLRRPADLKHHTLLHDMAFYGGDLPDWADWLARAGVRDVDPGLGPGFNLWSMLIDAAVAGQGVALARTTMADGDLKAGRLVQPFGPTLPSAYAYWLVSTPEVGEHRNVRLFREWLLAEAAGARDDA
jgi:LysR family glycine cleavage system transcriptional activator